MTNKIIPYGFLPNPLDYIDFNPLQYVPVTILDLLGFDSYVTEDQLKNKLNENDFSSIITTPTLYTTKNVFQFWAANYLEEVFFGVSDGIPQGVSEKEYERRFKKMEDFANLLKAYSISEPENVSDVNLLMETNVYISKLADYLLANKEEPSKKDFNRVTTLMVVNKIDKTGTTKPSNKIEEKIYKENRSLLKELKLKKTLMIAIPTVSLIGLITYGLTK